MTRSIICIISLSALLVLGSCSNIKMLTPADIYSDAFLKRMDGIQSIYKDGDKNGALQKLLAIDDKKITPIEASKKYNFIGIINFSNQNFDKAIENFNRASKNANEDPSLEAQVNLNLASSFYKKDQFQKSYEYLGKVDYKKFRENESQNYFKLRLVLAQQLDKPKDIVAATINLIGEAKTFNEVESHKYKDLLKSNFRKLSKTQRVYILDEYKNSKSIVPAYLAKEEALQRYYMGDRPGAEDVLSWINSEYSSFEDARNFIKEFEFRIENYSKIDVGAIGVILPLSGSKGDFGKKALSGIDSALNLKTNKILAAKVYTRDSKNNPHIAKKMINDLIQKHHVSVIIGGLFPGTANDEYLEAKKYGVLFISLSPVHLKKDQKNHLLIEVPGSIESQVEKIMNPEFLAKFGKRIAVMYPESEGGLAYVNEVWRRAEQGVVDIKAIHSFDRSNIDFREPVSKLLSVNFKREREEELDLWNNIYQLEKKTSSIRRIQTLKPIIDFDWVFVPAYPKDALQIIPTFSYYDAKKMKFIGGPSWLSKSLMREQRNLGQLYLVGINPKEFNQSFSKNYRERNKKVPRLIETLAYEAMNLSLKIIQDSKFEKREELERRLLAFETIQGVTGKWYLKDGIWIKEMDFMQLTGGTAKKFDLSEISSEQVNASNP